MGLKDKFIDLLSEEEESVEEETETEEFKVDLKEAYSSIKKLFEKEYTYYLLLIPALLTGLWIRFRNMNLVKGKYLLGLDPYYWYRLTEYFLEHGHLMQVDYMRLAPVGFETGFKFFPYFLAAWHKLVSIFTNQPQIYSHVIYPPLITVVAFAFFFLFVREIWGNKIALISTALFTVVPGYLYRTMAGFADHEALAMMWLFAALWVFVKFRGETEIGKKFLYAGIAGILTTLLMLTWSGGALITISLAVFVTLEILFDKINKKYFVGYAIWNLFFIIPLFILQGLNKIKDIRIMIVLFPLLAFIIYYILKKVKLTKTEKVSLGVQSTVLSGVLGLIAIPLLFSIDVLLKIITNPAGAARVSRTTSEIIGGVNLWGTFSWMLIFAILGALYLIYDAFKKNKKELAVLEIISVISLLLLLVIKKISHKVRLAGLGLFIAALIIIYLYHHYYSKKKFITTNKLLGLLPLSIFLVVAYLSKTAARFVFLVAPFIALMTGYFLVSIGKEFYKRKNLRLLSVVFIVIILALFLVNARSSANSAENMGSHLPGQWEGVMDWIKNSTPQDSVIAHWWDYGYWTQAVANRPSVEDGGKGHSYWIYTLARYGMTAFNNTKALTYFKSHNTSYLLYSSEEIGKYHAFSYLASEKLKSGDYDRESVIGTFSLAKQKEVRNGTLHMYQGGWSFDKDIALDNLVLPEGKARIGAFTVTMKNNTITKPPEAVVVHNKQRFREKIGCAYMNGKKYEWDVNSSLGGCVKFIPYFQNQQQVVQKGGLLYMSPKVYPGLFARLYILNKDVEGFKEVYNDKTPLGIYRGRIIGPIRVWKINYPENISVDESLLEIPENFEEEYGR